MPLLFGHRELGNMKYNHGYHTMEFVTCCYWSNLVYENCSLYLFGVVLAGERQFQLFLFF